MQCMDVGIRIEQILYSPFVIDLLSMENLLLYLWQIFILYSFYAFDPYYKSTPSIPF